MLTDHDVNEGTPFNDIADLLTGAQYLLTLSSVQQNEPSLYAQLANAVVAYSLGDASQLVKLASAIDDIVTRCPLVADPGKDPIRARLQLSGFESVQNLLDCINTLLKTARGNKSVSQQLIANLSSEHAKAAVMRKQRTPVTFELVNTLCDRYEELVKLLVTDSVLDMEVIAYDKHTRN